MSIDTIERAGEVYRIGNQLRGFDEPVRTAREALQAYSDRRIAEITESSRKSVEIYGDQEVTVGVLTPHDADESHWLVMPHPFANGLTPHMVLRGMAVQRSIGNGKHPILLLPNNDSKTHAYSLSNEDRQRMMGSGDNLDPTPLTDKLVAAIASVTGSEATPLSVLAYSQAAVLAPHLAPHLNVENMLVAEAPNSNQLRDEKELKKDFVGKGLENLRALNRAVLDAKLVSLADFLNVQKNGRVSLKQLIGLSSTLRASLLPENKILQKLMAGGSHDTDLISMMKSNPDIALTVARAEHSKIFKENFFSYYIQKLAQFNVTSAVLEGYGHEAADNIVQFAQLGRLACKSLDERVA